MFVLKKKSIFRRVLYIGFYEETGVYLLVLVDRVNDVLMKLS